MHDGSPAVGLGDVHNAQHVDCYAEPRPAATCRGWRPSGRRTTAHGCSMAQRQHVGMERGWCGSVPMRARPGVERRPRTLGEAQGASTPHAHTHVAHVQILAAGRRSSRTPEPQLAHIKCTHARAQTHRHTQADANTRGLGGLERTAAPLHGPLTPPPPAADRYTHHRYRQCRLSPPEHHHAADARGRERQVEECKEEVLQGGRLHQGGGLCVWERVQGVETTVGVGARVPAKRAIQDREPRRSALQGGATTTAAHGRWSQLQEEERGAWTPPSPPASALLHAHTSMKYTAKKHKRNR